MPQMHNCWWRFCAPGPGPHPRHTHLREAGPCSFHAAFGGRLEQVGAPEGAGAERTGRCRRVTRAHMSAGRHEAASVTPRLHWCTRVLLALRCLLVARRRQKLPVPCRPMQRQRPLSEVTNRCVSRTRMPRAHCAPCMPHSQTRLPPPDCHHTHDPPARPSLRPPHDVIV